MTAVLAVLVLLLAGFPAPVMQSTVFITTGIVECGGTLVSPTEVLTASHCVAGAAVVTIRSQTGGDVFGSPERVDVGSDLALVRLRGSLPGLVPAVLGQASQGDEVWIAGAPEGIPFVLWHGYIAAVRMEAFDSCDHSSVGARPHQTLLLDARLFPGNSGGGVYSADGHLIGVAVGSAIDAMCGDKVAGQQELWGYAVGPDEVGRFLGGP